MDLPLCHASIKLPVNPTLIGSLNGLIGSISHTFCKSVDMIFRVAVVFDQCDVVYLYDTRV
jgi:hypothetical protein